MHFTAPLVALVAVASAFPSELVPRAADLSQQVLSNLTTCGNDGVALNNTVNAVAAGSTAYTPSQQTTIVLANAQLAKDINSTAATTNASSVWTQTESGTIYNKVNNDLKPIIFSVLDNIVAHYSNFKASSQVGTVLTSLKNDRELTRELGNALTSKAVDPYASQSPALRDAILAKFDSAISKFSS